MKRLLIIIFFHIVWTGTKAQSLQSKVLNSGGSSHTSLGVTLVYSIGEFSIATFSKPGNGSIQSGFLHGLDKMNALKAEKDNIQSAITSQKISSVIVYPNPTRQTAVINFTANKTTKYKIELTGITGNILQIKTGETIQGENKIMLDVSQYAQGLYIIKISDNENGIRILELNKQ
ncbi:MAG: T9SS type A sorting domain-containing protein [Bacteroidetes bacterium]|nr:T9SS type A sorting domain-containing protein [Bacteroidota bacterium]